MLVEMGAADVHAVFPGDGGTALEAALVHDHLDTATLLVVHGCQPRLAEHLPGSAKRAALDRGLALRGPVALLKQQRASEVRATLGEAGMLVEAVGDLVMGYGAVWALEAMAVVGPSVVVTPPPQPQGEGEGEEEVDEEEEEMGE